MRYEGMKVRGTKVRRYKGTMSFLYSVSLSFIVCSFKLWCIMFVLYLMSITVWCCCSVVVVRGCADAGDSEDDCVSNIGDDADDSDSHKCICQGGKCNGASHPDLSWIVIVAPLVWSLGIIYNSINLWIIKIFVSHCWTAKKADIRFICLRASLHVFY